MLSFNLAPIFKARRIEKPYAFLVKAGLPSTTVHKILNNKTRTFRLEHVELLCKLLICEPNDLLAWTPETGTVVPENFPLLTMKQTTSANDLSGTLQALPYKQLKEVINTIAAKGNMT